MSWSRRPSAPGLASVPSGDQPVSCQSWRLPSKVRQFPLQITRVPPCANLHHLHACYPTRRAVGSAPSDVTSGRGWTFPWQAPRRKTPPVARLVNSEQEKLQPIERICTPHLCANNARALDTGCAQFPPALVHERACPTAQVNSIRDWMYPFGEVRQPVGSAGAGRAAGGGWQGGGDGARFGRPLR